MDEAIQKEKILISTTYLDGELALTVDPDPTPQSTKNALMHWGFYLTLLKRLDALATTDKEGFSHFVEECMVQRGLYNRLPGCPDESSHDDARGVCAGSSLAGLLYHWDVFEYGMHHWFIYNNVNPGKFAWFAFRLRLVDDVGWYFMLNDWFMRINPFVFVPVLGILTFRLFFGEVGYYRLLDYMLIESMAEKSVIWRLFRKFWIPRSDLVIATENYFNKPGAPEHPLVRLVVLALRLKK